MSKRMILCIVACFVGLAALGVGTGIYLGRSSFVPSPVPGHDVKFPNAEITITRTDRDSSPYSLSAAGPGSTKGAMGGSSCSLWWNYVAPTDDGDVYEMVILTGQAHASHNPQTQPSADEPRIVRYFAYAGKPMVIYEDEFAKITMQPENSKPNIAVPKKTPASAPAASDALSREDGLRLALFERWLSNVEQNSKQLSPELRTPCYLQVVEDTNGVDPSDALFAALKDHGIVVKKGSECISRGDGVLDIATQKKGGTILCVGVIKWMDPDMAEVEFSTYRAGTAGTWQKFKCRWTDGRWELTPSGHMAVS